MLELTPGSELERAAEEFFRAARSYREAMKRDPEGRKHLGGVIFIKHDDGSCVVYSESPKYTTQIANMTHDKHSDELVFSELLEKDE